MGNGPTRTCGYCGIELSEGRMVDHIKRCEKLNFEGKRPDGTSLKYDYSGENFATSGTAFQALEYKK
jgi:hypothetical protein